MNTNTTFKIEEFTSDDQDDSNKDSDDFTEINLNINQKIDHDSQLDRRLNHHFNQNLNYQYEQVQGAQYTSQQEFNEQVNHRLHHLINHHLINQTKQNQKILNQLKSVNQARLNQNKFNFNFFFSLFEYYENSLINLNLKLVHLVNYFVFWLNFFATDVFHCLIFKYLLTTNHQRTVLIKWLNKVTNHSLFKSGLDTNFRNAFGNGKLLCGLVDFLNSNACSRYDLLDVDDVHINLELAYRLIYTYYSLDEKISLENLNSNESEQLLINLISKIRYLEMKRSLYSKYGIESDDEHRNCKIEKKSVWEFSFFFFWQ